MFPMGVVLTAALCASTSGCLAVFGGVQNTTIDFPIAPNSTGSFFGWTEITVGGDINSVNAATLISVTLQAQNPDATPDLSFMSSLKGEAVTPTARTTVVTLDRFPKGEAAVTMNVVYDGDLHPLFKDNMTIRIEWTGVSNPAFTGWPADGSGFGVEGNVQIDIE
jgi:hypothetical protein